MENRKEILIKTLENIYQIEFNKPDKEFIVLLNNYLDNNDLNNSIKIPEWLVSFFRSILFQMPSTKTKFIHDRSVVGDVFNFLSELEDLIPVLWSDTGEEIEVSFSKLGMKGKIYVQGYLYETVFL